MAFNTTEEIYAFLSLTKQEVPQSVTQTAIDTGNAIVLAFAPDDGSARSIRMNPIRKQAEKFLASSEIFLHFANSFFLSQPPIRLIGVLSANFGADSPTPDTLLNVLRRVAEKHREDGFYYLRKVKPITTTIQAGE